jgi:hypothetical protein
MARRQDPDASPETLDDTAEPQTTERPADGAPDDVLVYIDRLGALCFHWNEAPTGSRVGGVVIPVQNRVRLEPGLSFCAGHQWPFVKGSMAWTERVKLGAIRAVAGQGGSLLEEWGRVKVAVLMPMLAKTFHLPALERLREMENALPRPRLDVAAEIDARLAEMSEKLGARGVARQSKRRANRGRVLG